MNSFPSQAFAEFAVENPYNYQLLCENTLISDLFQLNSPLKQTANLVFTNQYILLQLRSDDDSARVYALKVCETLAYRIFCGKQTSQYKADWELLLLFNGENLMLRAVGKTSSDAWDNLLRKTITKLGFHENFKPIRKMGVGTSATVFEVQRKKDNKRFAVKAFSKRSLNKEPKLKQGMLNEIKILRILSEKGHENVLNLHQIYESENSFYLVLDLCSGVLSNRLAQTFERMSETNIKHIIIQLLRGLTYIHSKNIAHRDIKLENILIQNKRPQPQVIIGDFGLSTFIEEENYLFTSCGTPGFVAPEVIHLQQNQKLKNMNCDVFAVGVIFHYLLTGRPVFQGNSFAEIYQNNKKMNFDLNHENYSRLNYRALDLLKGMLKIDPEQRLSSQEALKHQYFVAEEFDFKPQSPAASLLTNTHFQSSLQLPQIKLQGLQRQKQEYRKASHE